VWDSLCYTFAYAEFPDPSAIDEIIATLRDHTLDQLMKMRKDEQKVRPTRSR
jgi:hypothetical protein